MHKVYYFLEKLIFISVSYLYLFVSAVAQVNSYIPDSYNYFSQNITLYNPSYISSAESYKFMLNHKFLSGQFKDISYTNFTAAKNIYKDKNSMAFRAIVGKEQEGPYISIPSVSLSYGYELKLSRNVSFSSGVTLGATGVYFATPSLSSSFILPDGVLGLGLKVKKHL